MEKKTTCSCGCKDTKNSCHESSSCLSPDDLENDRNFQSSCPLTNESLPLEVLVELIDNEQVEGEIPFDLIVKEYPSLLDEWYPGYPGEPREMTEDDPVPVTGRVEGEFLVVDAIPGLGKIPIPPPVPESLHGQECCLWMKRDGDSIMVTLAEPLDELE